MKILIAEQSRSVSFSLQLLLERYGLEAEIANDGIQALESLSIGNYDLLITEIDLPRIGGETLVRLASQRGITVKTIGILPRSEVTENDLTGGYGMDALIPKPFSSSDLISLIAALADDTKDVYPSFSFYQRKLVNGLDAGKSLSVRQMRKMIPDSFGSIHAFVRSINSKLQIAGENRRIVSDANGYKVVNV